MSSFSDLDGTDWKPKSWHNNGFILVVDSSAFANLILFFFVALSRAVVWQKYCFRLHQDFLRRHLWSGVGESDYRSQFVTHPFFVGNAIPRRSPYIFRMVETPLYIPMTPWTPRWGKISSVSWSIEVSLQAARLRPETVIDEKNYNYICTSILHKKEQGCHDIFLPHKKELFIRCHANSATILHTF